MFGILRDAHKKKVLTMELCANGALGRFLEASDVWAWCGLKVQGVALTKACLKGCSQNYGPCWL